VFPAGGKGFHLPVLPGCINDHDSSRSPGMDTTHTVDSIHMPWLCLFEWVFVRV
jgi:hypothetical protein